MGFRDLISFNKAMLGKQAWRLVHQPHSLWGRLFKGLYYPHTDFWHAASGLRPSWGWRSLVLGRDSIAPKVQWKVGDGSIIKIREDKWLQRGIIEGPVNINEPFFVSQLIDKEHGRWDEMTIEAHFDEQLVEEILTIPIKPQIETDQLVWNGTQEGKYTVKSAYNFIKDDTESAQGNQATSSFQPSPSLWKDIWNLHTSPKIRIFMWNMCQNALPTKDNLFQRKVSPDPLCPLCHYERETVEHLFLLCPWTNQIWDNTELHLVAVTLWNMWKARNQAVFRGIEPEASAIIDSALAVLKSYNRWNPRKGGPNDSTDERSATQNQHRDDEWRGKTPPRLSGAGESRQRETPTVGENQKRVTRRDASSLHSTPELRNNAKEGWAASRSDIPGSNGQLRNRTGLEGTNEESRVGEPNGGSVRPSGYFVGSWNRVSTGQMQSQTPETDGQQIHANRRPAETHQVDGQRTHAINRSETPEAQVEDQRPNETCRSQNREAAEGGSETRRPHGVLQTRTPAEETGEEETSGRSEREQNGGPSLPKVPVFRRVRSGGRKTMCRKKKASLIYGGEPDADCSDHNPESVPRSEKLVR